MLFGELIRTARLGVAIVHLWLFALSLLGGGVRGNLSILIGAFYVVFPFGLLVYGWNDLFDHDVDALSQRKKDPSTGSLFGLYREKGKIAHLPILIALFQVPFLVVGLVAGYTWLLPWFGFLLLSNAAYNGPLVRLSRVPFLAELTAVIIYLHIPWLSARLLGISLSPLLWMQAVLAVLNLQILGAVVDIDADRQVGKRTLAAVLGADRAIQLVGVILSARVVLFGLGHHSVVGAALQCVGLVVAFRRFRFLDWHWSNTLFVYFSLADCLWVAGVLLQFWL